MQCADPTVRPLALVGDGAFQMSATKLGTCVRCGLNPIVIVLNNRTILAEVEGAKAKFGRGVGDFYRIEATGELWNPDLGLIGKALGADVYKVTKPGEFKGALEKALRSGRLAILDVDASHTVPRYAVPLVVRHGTMPFPYDWNMAQPVKG